MSTPFLWLKKLFPGASRGSRRATSSKKPGRRLALERLEVRLTPSLTPLSLTGFNQDVVFEAGAASPTVTHDFDDSGTAWFQAGAKDTSHVMHNDGLPTSFTSNFGTPFQFQSFNGPNALMIDTTGAAGPRSGMLTLTTPAAYADLAILASSSLGANAVSTGVFTINYGDGSSDTFNYNAPDWLSNAASSALPNDVGRALVSGNQFSGVGPSTGDNFQMFETDVHPNPNKTITSLTFHVVGGNDDTGIFAVSGGTRPQLTNLTVTPPTVSEGQPTPVNFKIASFTDPAGAGPITEQVQLVANGGFETGDFTGWTAVGNNTVVDQVSPHTGAFAANLATVNTLGSVSQSIPTVVGQSYTLTYWLKSDGQTPNEFQTSIGGNVVFDQLNIPSQPYTQYSFPFTATSSSTLIRFGERNDPGNLFLDDVSVLSTVTNYSATINWGDGSPPVAGTVVSDGGGNFHVVAPAHTYAEEGSPAITVTVSHDVLAPLSATGHATVSEVPVVAIPGPNIAGPVEGGSTGTVVVATFTDPAGAEPVDEYRAAIDWGDGSTSTGTVSFGAGTFTVIGSHTYTEESPAGGWAVNTTITHGSPPLGLANDGASGDVVVFDPATKTVLGSVNLPGRGEGYQTALSPDGSLGFAVNFTGHLFVLGLSNPSKPTVSSTIPISNAGEDLSVTPDGRFVVIVGNDNTISVVSVASRTEVHTFNLAVPGESVDASVPGIVLVTSDGNNTVTALAIDGSGDLTSTGTTLHFAQPLNVVVAPGGTTGVVLSYATGGLTSFTVPGLTAVGTRTLSNSNGLSAVFNSTGTIVYVRSTGGPGSSVDAFGFNPTTGALSASPLFTISVASTSSFYGVDQLAISADDSELFVPDGGTSAIDVFDARNGNALGSITDPGVISGPAGIFVGGGAGAATTTVTSKAFISDPAVIGTGGFFAAVEGALPVSAQTVATFTDPAGAEALGDYSATILWGDGTGPDTNATISFAAGTFTVQGNHRYAEEGTYTIGVLLQHGTAPNVTIDSAAVVSDPAVVLNTTPLSFTAVEGEASAVQTVATFADPGGAESLIEYGATIDWGDSTGPSTGTITYSNGAFIVSGSHTYAEEGSYPINVTVNHGTSTAVTDNTANAAVADAPLHEVALTPPTNVTAGTPTPTNAVLYHFADDNRGATAADFTATVSWGDGMSNTSADGTGSVQVVADPNGGFDVVGEHTYLTATTPGTVNNPSLNFNVQVVDDGGPSTTDPHGGPVAVSGDVVVTDTTGGQNLTLYRTTSASPVGAVSYILGSSPAVALTNIHSFTYNGEGAGDSMTVQYANGAPLLPAGLFFKGGAAPQTLTVDAGGQALPLRTLHGQITVGDVSPEATTYAGAGKLLLDNAPAIDAFAGPNTADRGTAFNGLTPDERAVQALYLAELGRAGSKAELDGWVSLLPAGATSLTPAVVNGVEHSAEARDHLVQSWYVAFLGRAAQNGEEQGFVNLLLAGQTEEQVLSMILGSAEFYARAQTLVSSGTADQRYVQALYLLLLNRTGEPGGAAGWVNALPQLGRQGPALGFLQSAEFRTYDFEGYDNALLHRPSGPAELNSWVMSDLDIGAVRVGFESGPEFFVGG